MTIIADPPHVAWENDPGLAPKIRRMQANGARVQIERYTDKNEPVDNDPILDIQFSEHAGLAGLCFNQSAGFWQLDVDFQAGGLERNGATKAQHVAAARAIILACQALIELNREKSASNGDQAMSNEILALMGDREMTRREFAEELGMSYQRLTSKLCGYSSWSVQELLDAATVLGRDDDQFDMLLHLAQVHGEAQRAGKVRS